MGNHLKNIILETKGELVNSKNKLGIAIWEIIKSKKIKWINGLNVCAWEIESNECKITNDIKKKKKVI